MHTRIRTILPLMATLATALIAASAHARAALPAPVTCPEEITNEVKVSPPDGNLGGFFGWYLDVDGDLAVAAAPGDDDDGVPNAGAVYAYHRDASGDWIQEAKLRPFPPQLGDLFGQSATISGDTIAVGAPGTTISGLQRSGAVYVYRRSPAGIWSLEAFLTPIDPGPQIGPLGDQFGYSVDLRGDRLVAGATHDDDIATDSGAVYIFDRVGTTWSQTMKLTASDGVGQDSRFLGNDAAVDGNTVVAGQGHEVSTLDRGTVYVYDFNGASWIETRLVASDGRRYDLFGQSVAVSGTFLVAGAFGDDDDPNGSQSLFKGAAYVFEKNLAGVWQQRAKLTDPNGANQDYFATQVAIAGNTVIAGNIPFNTQLGAAHVYRRKASTGAWKLLEKFDASDSVAGDGFGVSVSVRGKTLMVGAFGDDGVAPNSGSAYFFTIEEVCPTAP